MYRESLGTGFLPDRPGVVVAYDGIDQTPPHRHSTPRWGIVAILLWSLLTGCILTLFAGVLGCRPYHSLPETIGNDTKSVDAIMAITAPLPPIPIRDAESLKNRKFNNRFFGGGAN